MDRGKAPCDTLFAFGTVVIGMTHASSTALTDLLHAVRGRYRLVHVDETQSVLLLYVERLLRATGCEALRLRQLGSEVECVVALRPALQADASPQVVVALEYSGPGATARLLEIAAEMGASERWLLGWDQMPPREPMGRRPDPGAMQPLCLPEALTQEATTSAGVPSEDEQAQEEVAVRRRTLREAVYDEGRAAMGRALRRLINRWEAQPESGCFVELLVRMGGSEPGPWPAGQVLREFLQPGQRGQPRASARGDRTLLLLAGAPGSGKSTLLCHLAVSLAREHLAWSAGAGPLARAPVLLSLPPSRSGAPVADLDHLLEEAVPGLSGRLLRLWVELGLCVLLVDGPLPLSDVQQLRQLPTLLPDAPPKTVVAVRARYFVQGRGGPLEDLAASLLDEALRSGWDLGYLEPLDDELLQQYLLLRLPEPRTRSAALSQLARSDHLRCLCRRPGLLAMLTDGSAGPPRLGQGVEEGIAAPPPSVLISALRPAWLEGTAGNRRIERTAREVLARVLARRLLRSGGEPPPWWELLPEIAAEVPRETDGARLLLHVVRALDDPLFHLEYTEDDSPRLRFALASAADHFIGQDMALRLGRANVAEVTACLQHGSRGQIRAGALSRSGRLCATGADDGTVRLWEAQSGFLLRVLAGHCDPITALLFVLDDTALVSAARDYTLRLWDVRTGRLLARLVGHTDAITALAGSPSAALICSASADGTVRVWQLPEGRCVQTLRPPEGEGICCVAMSPDGLLCAAAAGGTLVYIFHAWSGELLSVLDGHSGPVRTLALSPDGRLCASGSQDATVRLTEVHTGNLVQVLRGHQDGVTTLSFSPDGRLLATGSADQTVRIHALAGAGEHTPAHLLHCIQAHSGSVHCVAFRAAGPPEPGHGGCTSRPGPQLLLTTGGDGAALLWGAAEGRLLRPLDGSAAMTPSGAALEVCCVAAAPDGTTLAVGGTDGVVRLWDLRTGRLRAELCGHEGQVLSLAFSPSGQRLASGGSDQTVCLWDPQMGELVDCLQGHAGEVTTVAFSPDGYLLASGSTDQTVRVREAAGGLTLCTLRVPSPITHVIVLPEGRWVAAASADGSIRLWEVSGGPPVKTLRRHLARVTALAASADGGLLCSGGDDQVVQVWDVHSGRAMHVLWGHLDGVTALALSPDGETLASASWDRSIRLWEARSGRALGVLDAGPAWPRALTFTPDGHALVAGGYEGLLVWQVATGRLLGRLLALGDGWVTLVPAEGAAAGGSPRWVLYAADREAPPALRMTDGLVSYPSAGWARLCHRPDLVSQVLSGGPCPDLAMLRDELHATPLPLPELESSGSQSCLLAEPATDSADRERPYAVQSAPVRAQDLLSPEQTERGELDRGAVVPRAPVPYAAGRISGRLHALLAAFVVPRQLGDVPSAGTGYLLQQNPDVLRAPDVSFVSAARIPPEGMTGYFAGAPDLAAEVVSAANSWEAAERKAQEYLRTGTHLVWILHPQTRTVHVHESPVQVRILGETDVLTGGSVLPGFSIALRELFAW
ncbi:MAG: Uma2 family endonuclease [Myxococcota bacterium]|nr:Uma2 family endonuclease [Myxococcota bacterium]